jgi:vitamin B12 transporter
VIPTQRRAAARCRPLPAAASPLLFVLPFLPAHAALAQAAEAGNLSPAATVIVTAARAPEELSRVLADVTVVTRDEIQRRGYGDLADVLRATGAMELARNGGPGTATSLYLRGSNSEHTMVLVDGVRLESQAGSGGAAWETIPLSQIDHVEIVKGPASAMYGSDAIGGVVQVFTIEGRGAPRLDLGVAGGNLGTARADGSVSGSSGAFDYAVSAGAERSDGFALVPDPHDPSGNYNPEAAGYRKHDGALRLGVRPGSQDRIELIGLASHLANEFNDYSPTALGQQTEDADVGKLGWSRAWTPALDTRVSLGESRSRLDDITDAYRVDTRLRSASVDGHWRATPAGQLLFALDHQDDRLEGASLPAGAGDRHDNDAALGLLWQQGAFDAQAHVRHDEDSEFGGADTGSLGLGWRLAPALQVVALAGDAFRAPTLYENASVYGPLSLPGGDSLRPEKGHSIEVGLRLEAGDVGGSLTAWHNRVDDLIDFRAATTCLDHGYGCYVNVDRARLQGVSLEGRWQMQAMEWTGTFDLQSPEDLATGLTLPRRAREFGTLRAVVPWQAWRLSATLSYSDKRYDDAANQVPLGAYTLANFAADYPISRELTLQANVDNAFDRRYQTAAGYAQPPRTVMLGLRWAPAR